MSEIKHKLNQKKCKDFWASCLVFGPEEIYIDIIPEPKPTIDNMKRAEKVEQNLLKDKTSNK